MYCENCGKELPAGGDRCPGCGHGLEDIKPQWLGIASMVLALVGFNIAAIVTGLIAILTRRPGRTFAFVGVAVAVLRMVIAVFAVLLMFWFGLFVYLADRADSHKGKSWSSEECTPREHRWKGKFDFDRDDDDTELNIDTSWAGRVPAIVRGIEDELDELEELLDDVEYSLGDEPTEEQSGLLDQAESALEAVDEVLPRLEDATEQDVILDLTTEAHRNLLSARAALDELNRD